MAVSDTSPNTDNYFIGKGNVYWMGTSDTAWRHVGNVPEFEVSLTIDKLDHFSSMEGTRKKDRSIVREQGGTVRMVLEELTAQNLELALMGEASSAAVTLSTTGDISTGERDILGMAATTNLVTGRRYSVAATGIPAGATAVYNGDSTMTLDMDATATTADVALTIAGAISLDIFSQSEKAGKLRFVGSNDVGAQCTYDLNNVSLTPSSSFNPISDEWGNFEVTGEILVDEFGKFGQVYWNTGASGV